MDRDLCAALRAAEDIAREALRMSGQSEDAWKDKVLSLVDQFSEWKREHHQALARAQHQA